MCFSSVQALRAMQAQMEAMANEAALKDQRLAALHDDFALAVQGQEVRASHQGMVLAPSTQKDVACLPCSGNQE